MSDHQPPTDPASPDPIGPGGRPIPPIRTGLFGTPPDIGSPRSRLAALVTVCLLYGVLALSANLSPYFMDKPSQVGREPMGGEVAKLTLLFQEAFSQSGTEQSGLFVSMTVSQFATNDLHPADRLQAVLVLGEGEGPDEALDWLAAVRSGQDLGDLSDELMAGGDWQSLVEREPGRWAMVLTPEGDVDDPEAIADAEAMEALYTGGLDALSDERRTRLRDRYGWLGELATTPEDSAEYDALFADIPWAVAMVVVVVVVLFIAGVGGLAMAILAAIFFFTGRLKRRFEPPKPGGSVFLETFAVFLACFGLVQFGGGVLQSVVMSGVEAESDAADVWAKRLILATLVAQWLLVFTIFWPRLRGVTRDGWRDALGWRAPQGVWREVGAGVAGYFAALPVLFVAMIFTVVINMVAQAFSEGPVEPPNNPVVELVGAGDALVIVVFLSLATIWAPIVEETLFRGAVYRHMRARFGVFVCALVTALLFAFMHSYGPLMVAPLITLGFTFAIIREWRGSIIGPVVAHALHNGTLMVMMLIGLQAMS